MRAFANSLDAIPLALAENSGLSPIDTLADVKSRQVTEGNPRLGIDCLGRAENGESCVSGLCCGFICVWHQVSMRRNNRFFLDEMLPRMGESGEP